MISHRGRVTEINAQESVVLYPTYGHLTDGGRSWRVLVAGAVFEPGQVNLRKRIMIRLLRKVMQVSADHLDSEIFRERIGGFIAAMGRGRRIVLQVGPRIFQLPKKTKRNGQFAGVLRIPRDLAEPLEGGPGDAGDWLSVRVVTPLDDERIFEGRAQLLGQAGISVISDIDDTIKHSHVSCRRALLANTFLRGFESIEGMSEQYRVWKSQGATFHYVSSSPWQLFHPLHQHCQEQAFPDGTIHLRSFRIRDHMLRRVLLIRRPGKGVVIKHMLQTFPGRQFYLVGDSGERDPELYGALARRFRDQVVGIFIRQVRERPLHGARAEKAFRRLPDDLWRPFDHADQLPDRLGLGQSREITPCVAKINP